MLSEVKKLLLFRFPLWTFLHFSGILYSSYGEGGKAMAQFAKRMKCLLKRADFWVFSAASFFLLLFAVTEGIMLFSAGVPKSAVRRVLLSLVICALYYLGGRLCVLRTDNTRILRRLSILFWFFYLYLLLNFTLLDKGMGRGTLVWDADGNVRDYYLSRFVNFRPFRSIYEVYILGFVHGYVNAYYMLLNLLGNVCAFMPFALFLPLFWRAQKRWYVFVPTVIVAVATVEMLQFVFMVGSCDIDDLILNAGGAVFLYFILRIPPIWHTCERLMGAEE